MLYNIFNVIYVTFWVILLPTLFKMAVDTLYIKIKGNQLYNSFNSKHSKLFLRHFYSLVN